LEVEENNKMMVEKGKRETKGKTRKVLSRGPVGLEHLCAFLAFQKGEQKNVCPDPALNYGERKKRGGGG